MDKPFACRIDVKDSGECLNFIARGAIEKTAHALPLSYEFVIRKSSVLGTVQSRQSGEVVIGADGNMTLATIGVGKSLDLAVHARLTVSDSWGRMFTCSRHENAGSAPVLSSETDL